MRLSLIHSLLFLLISSNVSHAALKKTNPSRVEKVAMKKLKVKFVQISVSQKYIFALSSNGKIWRTKIELPADEKYTWMAVESPDDPLGNFHEDGSINWDQRPHPSSMERE